MNFGDAIYEMKCGGKVRRAGWNGKGMYVYLRKEEKTICMDDAGKALTEPFFIMFTAQGKLQAGWLASQADMLAEDWEVV